MGQIECFGSLGLNFCDKILNECVAFSLLTFPELGPSFIVLSTINNDFSSSSVGQHNIA